MNELISVIVPVYKAEQHLERCVNSIINQSYTNLEIILVEDGSPDKSGELCDKLALKDKRIKVFHKENGGQASARNYGLSKATGDYIGFVDDDDEIANDMYETLLKNAKKYQVSVSGCSTMMVYEDGRRINRFLKEKSGFRFSEELILNVLYQNTLSWGTVWNKIFQRKIVEKLAFPEGYELEDYWVMIHIFYEEEKVYFEQKPMYSWYQYSSSQSKRAYHKTTKTSLEISRRIFEYLVSNGATKDIIKAYYHFEFCIRCGIINAILKSEDKDVHVLIPKEGKKALKLVPKILFNKQNTFEKYKQVLRLIYLTFFYHVKQ